MKIALALAVAAAVLAGCKKDREKADNSATRYASSLQQDTVKARENAQKANDAVAAEDARVKEAGSLGN